MASISKVGSTYKVRVSVKEGTHYKRKTKAGFKTKTAAKGWANEQETLKNTSGLSTGENLLFSEYFETWYKLYKTDSSLRWYKYTHKLIVDSLPNVTLQKLNRPLLQDFFNQLAQKYAYSTNRKVRMYIRSSLQSVIYDGLIYRDSTQGIVITGKEGKSKDLKFLEEKQMSDVIQLIQSKPITERNISDEMILTGLYTGARYQEIAALTLSDIEPGMISINKAWEQIGKVIKETKTKTSNRVIDVPFQFTNELIEWASGKPKHDFLFSDDGIKPVSSAAPNKRLRYILEKIHSPKKITFHGLRHTHASWLLSQGIDTQYVSERLGHSSVSITLDVYTHLLQNKRETETEKSVNLFKILDQKGPN